MLSSRVQEKASLLLRHPLPTSMSRKITIRTSHQDNKSPQPQLSPQIPGLTDHDVISHIPKKAPCDKLACLLLLVRGIKYGSMEEETQTKSVITPSNRS